MLIIFKECTIFNRKTVFRKRGCFLALCVGFQIEIFIAKIEFRNFLRILSKIIDKFVLKVYNEVKEIIYKEVLAIKISYKKLWILLIEKEISPATLRKDLNIATGTMTKMRKNEEVALSVLLRICEYLDCNIGDICDAVKVKE